MNRRDCLHMAGLLSALAFVPTACNRRSPLNDPVADSELHECNDAIGVQLFAVRDLMVADPRGTLAMLSEIGFREVELFGFDGSVFIDDPLFGLSATEFRDALDDVGLSAPIAHVSSDFEDISAVAGIASSLGVDPPVEKRQEVLANEAPLARNPKFCILLIRAPKFLKESQGPQ